MGEPDLRQPEQGLQFGIQEVSSTNISSNYPFKGPDNSWILSHQRASTSGSERTIGILPRDVGKFGKETGRYKSEDKHWSRVSRVLQTPRSATSKWETCG
jgi:hypothetical protein